MTRKDWASGEFEGGWLVTYGHGAMAVPQVGVAPNVITTPSLLTTSPRYTRYGGESSQRVAARLGAVGAYNYGMNLCKMGDLAVAAIGNAVFTTARTYLASLGAHVCILDNMIYDICQNANVADTDYQNKTFKEGLRTFLAAAEASGVSGSRKEHTAGTQTGTWGGVSNAFFSGGSETQTQVQNSALSWANVNSPRDHVWLIAAAYDSTVANVGGVFTVSVDGVDVPALTGLTSSGAMKQYFSNVGSVTYTNIHRAYKIPLTANTNHTVAVRKTDAVAGAFFNVDCLLIPAPQPPRVIILKDPPILSTVASPVAGKTMKDCYDLYASTYRSLIDSVATSSEFSDFVSVIDLNQSGWDPTTMIASNDANGLLPNDLGASYYADCIINYMANNYDLFASNFSGAYVT